MALEIVAAVQEVNINQFVHHSTVSGEMSQIVNLHKWSNQKFDVQLQFTHVVIAIHQE